jgi:hypothetical protein
VDQYHFDEDSTPVEVFGHAGSCMMGDESAWLVGTIGTRVWKKLAKLLELTPCWDFQSRL